jgi:hypothetical protein
MTQTPNSAATCRPETRTPEIQQVILEQVLKVLQGGADPKRAMDDAQKLVQARAAQIVGANRARTCQPEPAVTPAARRIRNG